MEGEVNALYNNGELCPYCDGMTVYVDSEEVYGKSYGMIYLCRPCRAWVGVHKGTDKALGRLADSELRKWKKMAHFHFDQIWKQLRNDGISQDAARKWAYNKLGALMSLDPDHTHIGMFDIDQCKQVVALCEDPANWVYDQIGPGLLEWASQYGTVIDLRGK